MLSQALQSSEEFETLGNALVFVPESNNSGSFQFGNGSKNIDVRVVLNTNSDKYFLCDVSTGEVVANATMRCNQALIVNGAITLSGAVSIGTTLSVTGATTLEGDLSVNSTFRASNRNTRTIISSGVTILNTDDFGKFIFSATNHKFLQLPDPVGNTGAEFNFYQSITRNTTFQCVNATAGRFADTGDSAINSIRINTFADTVRMISSGVDWLVTPLGNTTSNIARNVATSF